jgi:hypothetical protein
MTHHMHSGGFCHSFDHGLYIMHVAKWIVNNPIFFVTCLQEHPFNTTSSFETGRCYALL